MAANAEIFFEHGPWGRALAWSVGLHVAFAAFIVLYAVIIPATSGQGWGAGGGGEAMGVSLVSTVPLPANPAPTIMIFGLATPDPSRRPSNRPDPNTPSLTCGSK